MRRTIGMVTLIGLLIALVIPIAAHADGDGSPNECKTPYGTTGDPVATYTAPATWTITGVCIKAGQLHTGVIGNGTLNACYTVAGVGTNSVTVTRIGSGPTCQAISHVDVVKTQNPPDTTEPPDTTVPDTTEPEQPTTTEAPPSTTITTPPTTDPTTSSTTPPTTAPTTTISEQTTSTVPPSVPTTSTPSATSPPPQTPTTQPNELPLTGLGATEMAGIASAMLLAGLTLLRRGKEGVN